MKPVSLVVAGLALLAAGTADAQPCYWPGVPRPVYPAPRVGVGALGHASTPAEGLARGRADLVRAQGIYKLLSAQAMLHLAEARRLQIENRVARAEAFFRLREINRSHRQKDRVARPPRYAAADRDSRRGDRPAAGR